MSWMREQRPQRDIWGRTRRSLGAVASLLFAVPALLVIALVNGGLTYRYDCATASGGIDTHWTYEWNAPIPYLLRPSRSGCRIHDATRVALSALGFDKIGHEFAGTLALSGTTNPADAYFAQIYAVATDESAAVKTGNQAAVTAAFAREVVSLRAIKPPAFATAENVRFDNLYMREKDDWDTLVRNPTTAGKKKLTQDIGAVGRAYDELKALVIANR